jgi:hypothetical protein
MLGSPFHDEPKRSRRDGAMHDRECLDLDLYGSALVGCMEMWGIVVCIVEPDHDTEEAAQFWHCGSLGKANAQPLILRSTRRCVVGRKGRPAAGGRPPARQPAEDGERTESKRRDLRERQLSAPGELHRPVAAPS